MIYNFNKAKKRIIIENKRDDTGVDVTWQAINYASFCSTLTRSDIVEIYDLYLKSESKPKNETADAINSPAKTAEQLITEFIDDEKVKFPSDSPKIILVSHKFRSEVLSCVQWLNTKGLDITCIQLKPFKHNDTIFIETDRILPQDEIKDYTLKLARKTTDEKQQEANISKAVERNKKFWAQFADFFDRNNTIFDNINSWYTNKESWIGAGSNFAKITNFVFVISNEHARVELYMDNKKEYNKAVFDKFYEHKEEIEKNLSEFSISWERLDEKNASRIAIRNENLKPKNETTWEAEIFPWLKNTMLRFVDVLSKYSNEIRNISI